MKNEKLNNQLQALLNDLNSTRQKVAPLHKSIKEFCRWKSVELGEDFYDWKIRQVHLSLIDAINALGKIQNS